MDKKKFDELIEKKTDVGLNKDIDVEQELNEWKTHLDILYRNIELWLKDYLESGNVTISTIDHNIVNDLSRSYSVKRKIITLGNEKIRVTPIGTSVVGGKGRVDFEGTNRKIIFGLCDEKLDRPNIRITTFYTDEERKKYYENESKKEKEKVNWVWKIITSPPNIKYIKLTQDSFFDAFAEVING